jgi:hypothetical protein
VTTPAKHAATVPEGFAVGLHECKTCPTCATTFAAVHPVCPKCAQAERATELERERDDLLRQRIELQNSGGVYVVSTDDLCRQRGDAWNDLTREQERAEQLETALWELVRLKDGPRGDAYRAAKEAAWGRARDALDGGTTTPEPDA